MGATPDTPTPVEGELLLADARFADGSTLPELRLSYTTLGRLRRDAEGRATNAVLLLHGTGGSGRAFLREQFADVLFGPGQPLDAGHHFLIMPDGIGHGGSSKPSDGLRAEFPRYTYADMVAAQHRLVSEGLGVDRLRLRRATATAATPGRSSGSSTWPGCWASSRLWRTPDSPLYGAGSRSE